MLQLVTTSEPVEWLTGAEVMREVGELLRERLPRVPEDDPLAGSLRALAPLARSCSPSPRGAA